MNITKVLVVDPRKQGMFEDPYICIHVDEDLEEEDGIIYDASTSRQYRLIQCGPFYDVERRDPDQGWLSMSEEGNKVELGVVNKIGLLDKQLIHVRVISPEYDYDMAMRVDRARRLLRNKSKENYKVTVDEQAAMLGLLKWRLEFWRETCYGGAKPGEAKCRRAPVATLVLHNTHLPLCGVHQDTAGNTLAANRVKRKN